MTSFSQRNRNLKVHTSLGEGKLLVQRVVGEEALSSLFEYNLELQSSELKIVGEEIVGHDLTIELQLGPGKTRVINGCVSHFTYCGQTAHQKKSQQMASYSAKIRPWLWLLDNRRDCRIFQNLSTPVIIQQVFQKLGFRDFEISLTANYPPREYCVQYQETDFNFVSRLMEEEGIYYFFRHEMGKHVLCLRDSVSGYFDLADSQASLGTDQNSQFQLTGWKHNYEFRPGKVEQGDFNFIRPSDRKMRQKKEGGVRYKDADRFEIFEYPGRYDDSEVGKRLTQVRMEELEVPHDVVEGAGTYASFTPGGKFTVEKHPRDSEQNKAFMITRIGLSMTNNLSGGVGPVFNNTFSCIPATTVFRPARRAMKPRIEGVQTAVITTDGKDEEIVVDEHGRVKVQFHWDRYGKRDFQSSCWIRVSQVHAGKGWGMMDIPRQNEEVIVSFVDGDPDRPIITGRVYNGENSVPFSMGTGGDNIKNKTRRGNMTKSYGKGSVGFNEMSMDDTPGQEQISIHGQYNLDTRVNNNETHSIGMNRTKDIGIDETMTIGNNQKLDVAVNKAVTVGTNHDETVGANQTINVGANQSVTVAANQSTKIGAKQDINIGSKQSVMIGMMKNETVGMMSNEMVGAMKTTNVGAVYSIISGAAMNTAVGFISAEEVGMTKKIIVGSKLEIIVGASKLVMEAGGKVTIEGTEFLFSASGNVKINGSVIDLN